MRILPPAVEEGAKIAVIAPSSPAPLAELERGLRAISAMGYEPVVYPSCLEHDPQRGYLAGVSDQAKIDDLHAAFANSEIKAVFCLRGGSGAGRLLANIDLDLIAANPKPFIGYSDITILHCLIAKAGIVTYHGPMVASECISREGPSLEHLVARLKNPTSKCSIPGTNLVPGDACGELVGGNLAVLCTSIGTRAEVDMRGKILLIEDIDEEPYSIDRLLTHLINQGAFKQACGIVLGDFTNCLPPEKPAISRGRAVADVISDLLLPLGLPILSGLPAGHGEINLTLPLGRNAEILPGYLQI